MGLFDEVENMAGQGGEDALVQKATQEGEQLLDNETGDKFDSEIQEGGNMLDQQVDKELPNLLRTRQRTPPPGFPGAAHAFQALKRCISPGERARPRSGCSSDGAHSGADGVRHELLTSGAAWSSDNESARHEATHVLLTRRATWRR
jgi:hypothetical protein